MSARATMAQTIAGMRQQQQSTSGIRPRPFLLPLLLDLAGLELWLELSPL